VICSNCSRSNPEDARYCLACAKRLAEASNASSGAPSKRDSRAAKVNGLAVTSLILSFFSLLFPAGIAAVILGHVSRRQIAKSGGREKGTGLAFAALILSYSQLLIVAMAVLAVLGFLNEFHHELDKKPYLREALLERIVQGDPNAASPAKTAKHTETAIQTLHEIRAKEIQYLAAHPDLGYACQLYLIGFDPGRETELGMLMRESDYDTKFIRCSQLNGPNYVVLSVPRSTGNTVDAPVFCLDQLNGIEKYTPEQSRDAVAAIMTQTADPCPLTGEHVE